MILFCTEAKGSENDWRQAKVSRHSAGVLDTEHPLLALPRLRQSWEFPHTRTKPPVDRRAVALDEARSSEVVAEVTGPCDVQQAMKIRHCKLGQHR